MIVLKGWTKVDDIGLEGVFQVFILFNHLIENMIIVNINNNNNKTLLVDRHHYRHKRLI